MSLCEFWTVQRLIRKTTTRRRAACDHAFLKAPGEIERGRIPVHREVTADALQRFYRNRMPRVAGISLLSGLASDLIINAST